MTHQLAGSLEDILHPRGIAVVVEGANICARMRGVRKDDARMVTNTFLGEFKEDERIRQAFFAQIQLHSSPFDEFE